LPIIEEPKEEKNLDLKKEINEKGFFAFKFLFLDFMITKIH